MMSVPGEASMRTDGMGVHLAFDEAIDILRPHTTPPHRWRAAARALEACSGLAEDPPPICSFKTMSAMRWGLHCDFVCACLPGRAPRGMVYKKHLSFEASELEASEFQI